MSLIYEICQGQAKLIWLLACLFGGYRQMMWLYWFKYDICSNVFTLQGSVEQRMEAVQARKQRMISGALTDQEVRSARIEELKMLFT